MYDVKRTANSVRTNLKGMQSFTMPTRHAAYFS